VICFALPRPQPDKPLGVSEAVEAFLRREEAERFADEVRADEPELVDESRIVEQELTVRASMN
jgi:hypothetical protein